MDVLENTLKCEKLGGYLFSADGDCLLDDFVLENSDVNCVETLKGKWVTKRMFPAESMHHLGTVKSLDFNNPAEYKLCKFPLKNIENIKKEHYDKLQFEVLLRVFNRGRFNNATVDKKKELVKDSQFLNFLIGRAKDIVDMGQQHAPMMFIKSGDEISIALLSFEDDEGKERVLKNVRDAITKGQVKKYWIIMEAWTGDNPFIRPKHDAKRKEALVISEYEKGETRGKQIYLPFERDFTGKPIWQKRREILGASLDEVADRWNFFMEDVMDEKMAIIREQTLTKDMKKIKEDFMKEQKERGLSKEELDKISETFDKAAENIKKRMKGAYGDDKI